MPPATRSSAHLGRICVSSEDSLCGRLGGEEFYVFLPGCGPDAARAHIDAIRLDTEDVPSATASLRIKQIGS